MCVAVDDGGANLVACELATGGWPGRPPLDRPDLVLLSDPTGRHARDHAGSRIRLGTIRDFLVAGPGCLTTSAASRIWADRCWGGRPAAADPGPPRLGAAVAADGGARRPAPAGRHGHAGRHRVGLRPAVAARQRRPIPGPPGPAGSRLSRVSACRTDGARPAGTAPGRARRRSAAAAGRR
jgi:hypothetical protein